ncbi:MAG: Crp/Fnr family transcriptional regulator [Rhizomicrobium sp.]
MRGFAAHLNQAALTSLRCQRGQLIYSEGQVGAGLYIVISGCVRLQIHSVEGHRQVVAFKLPGDFFGYCAALCNTTAEAASETVLAHYSKAAVTELLALEPAVALYLIERASESYGDLAGHLARISHLPAIERVQWFFKWLAGHNGAALGSPLSLPMSQRDISDYLNVAPETFSRVMQRLYQEGKLARLGRRQFICRSQHAKARTLPVMHFTRMGE